LLIACRGFGCSLQEAQALERRGDGLAVAPQVENESKFEPIYWILASSAAIKCNQPGVDLRSTWVQPATPCLAGGEAGDAELRLQVVAPQVEIESKV
jgi:hypothetical protein